MDYNQLSGESGPWGTRGGLVAAAAGHGGCPLELATNLREDFTITETITKLLGRAFSWLEAPSGAFNLRHY